MLSSPRMGAALAAVFLMGCGVGNAGLVGSGEDDGGPAASLDGGPASEDVDGGAVAFDAPVNLTPPAITGVAEVGQTLTVAPGVWEGAVDALSYQWLRCRGDADSCRVIEGAEGLSYLVEVADVLSSLRVEERATHPTATVARRSEPTDAVPLSANCQFTPPKFPTVSESVELERSWTQPEHVLAADGQVASVVLGPQESSRVLEVRDFGFSLPAGAKLQRVEIRVLASSTQGLAGVRFAELYIPGASELSLQPTATLGTSPAVEVLSWSADQGGLEATPVELNDPDTHVRLRYVNDGTAPDTVQVDAVELRVEYLVRQSVGPFAPATVVNSNAVGSAAWADAAAAAVEGGAAATVNLVGQQVGNRLVATHFGVGLPAGETPTGFLIEQVRTGLFIFSDTVQLLLNNAPVGSPKVGFIAWNSRERLGGSDDLWGANLSAAELADASFGFQLDIKNDSAQAMSRPATVDSIRLTVFYGPENSVVATGIPAVVEAPLQEKVWNSPNNARALDGVFSTASGLSTDSDTQRLKVSGFNVGLPADAVVLGHRVTVSRAVNGDVGDRRVHLMLGDARSENRALEGAWSTASATYGANTDNWGLELSAAEVNSADLAVGLSARYLAVSGNTALQVDAVSLEVFYCAP